MSYINLRCKTCGGLMSLDLSSKNILCSHCGKAYKLSGLLNDHDFRLISKMSDKELNYKITANSFVKEGDSLLYQASYEKAEQSYKKAIEIDELNYRAYLGVVRAKTHNLNILPNVDDYRYYARKAVEFADDDDKIYVKNELSKLALLRQEKQKRTYNRNQEAFEKQCSEKISQAVWKTCKRNNSRDHSNCCSVDYYWKIKNAKSKHFARKN